MQWSLGRIQPEIPLFENRRLATAVGGELFRPSLTFSFARALQQTALTLWAGQESNRVAAQQALLHRAQFNSAALRGEYNAQRDSL